jgi:hypothetical protein
MRFLITYGHLRAGRRFLWIADMCVPKNGQCAVVNFIAFVASRGETPLSDCLGVDPPEKPTADIAVGALDDAFSACMQIYD